MAARKHCYADYISDCESSDDYSDDDVMSDSDVPHGDVWLDQPAPPHAQVRHLCCVVMLRARVNQRMRVDMKPISKGLTEASAFEVHITLDFYTRELFDMYDINKHMYGTTVVFPGYDPRTFILLVSHRDFAYEAEEVVRLPNPKRDEPRLSALQIVGMLRIFFNQMHGIFNVTPLVDRAQVRFDCLPHCTLACLRKAVPSLKL